MSELAAQVTSSLLRFPDVTVDALGEDEITLDSVLHGKFTVGRSGLAWLACGPHLEVVHATTGQRFSAYRFSGVSEHAPNVLAVRDFCWLKRTGLLVGLEESEGSLLCLYDLGISRVVKAVVIPGRITAIEPLVSYGGASTSTQHLHQSLRWFFGVAAVVTDIGHVLLVDLCLDDPSCSQSELEASDLEVVNKSPAEIPHIRERVTQQGRHLCLQLNSPTGTGATALQYVTRTNQLAVGFSDGYLQLWNMKTLKKEYHSQLEGGRVPVYAFTFQEPENDPRNCCYLWAVQSTQDNEGDVVSLHLLQLAFGERKCLASGKILYEGLEYCEERYSQDLNGAAFPLRAQATNTRLLGCQTIEKFRHHPDRDDSMNEGASPDTSVSIFSWQVKSYGQGKPSTYVGVFDINRWYHAQMPDSLRTGESLHNCPYLAVWSLDAVVEMTSPCTLLDLLVHERSLSRGLPYTCPPPEQFFNPTTYNFDATCLLNSGVMHLACSGYQKETLSFLKRSAPYLSEAIPDGYSRCLMSGLLSPRLADVQPSNLSQEEQLDAILSAAVETSSLGLITGCIKRWTAEEQPGSAVNLRYILEWAWNKVVLTKEELDGICAPLFDSSTNFTDPQTLQLLQHSQRLLGNLSTIFHCLLSEAQELTQKGLVGLVNKNVVSSLISQYAQVVLWFCRTGLLPEGSDDDVLQISRPFYNYPVIKNYYTGRREELQRLSRGKWCADCLMIDGLVAQFADRIEDLWKRDDGGTGVYPPPTLHALLDIYLLENMEESAKHAIVIYLLLDVMYSLPNKSGTSVESFPTAFAIPIGLVKLVQGLWLLDHHDHENSLELLLHPATSRSLWGWQHERVLQALMCQGQHAIALRYLHTMKPAMSTSSQLKLCLSVLLHNRCMVEAWALLRQHSNKLNMEELLRFLYESCQDLGLMKELLKLPLGLAEQECLEKFLQNSGGLQNRELLMVHYLQQANYVPALQLNQAMKTNLNDRDPKLKERSNTRNSILDQYGKVLPRVQRKLATERAKPYRHPSTVFREVSRPQPLSTVAKRSATENVLTRAAFISNVLSKIGEVWEGKNSGPDSSPVKSPKVSGAPSASPSRRSVELPEAFVGTPITMSSKRMTRVLNLIVRPSSQLSPESPDLQQTPPRRVSSLVTPGHAPASSLKSGSFKGIAKAPELSLLQTPQVVKRARALTATGPVFPGFTPQSILRSSLRPTPVGSPSASPGRSVTPPPRPKESRITFIEDEPSADVAKGPVHWSNGIAAETEISLLSRASSLPKPEKEGWCAEPDEEEEEEGEQQPVTLAPPAVEPQLREPEDSERDVEMGESESCSSARETVEDKEEEVVVGRPSIGLEVSYASVQSVDTTLEYHDAPAPEDLEMELQQLQQPVEEDTGEVVEADLKPAAADVSPLPPTGTGEEEQSEAPIEQSLKQEEAEPHPEQEEAEQRTEPNEAVENPEQQELDQRIEQEEAEQNPEEEEARQSHKQEEAEQILEQVEAEQSLEQEEAEKNPRQEEVEKSLEPEEAEQSSKQEEVARIPEHEEAECIPEQEETQQEQNVELEEAEPSNKHEEAEEESPELEVLEPSPEREEAKPRTEHIDLDEFVERHLFGDDLSPPLTRSSIRQASQSWTNSSNSESSFDGREEEPATAGTTPPALTTQKSVTSVSSAPTTTTDSHSVVSLNDSEELSRASSEEEESDTGEEDEDEEEEDSGSEVEIVEEVEGNGGQRHLPNASLFLQEPPHGSEYLDEPATAVLSLVAPEMELKTVEAVEEEEVVMVDLEAEEPEEDGNEVVCYTELKPSDTLLVPLDLDEEQQLVDGAGLALHELEPEPHIEAPTNFTLMLEAEELENGLARPLVDSDNQLLIVQLSQGLGGKEQPGEEGLGQEQADSQEVFPLDSVNPDACEGLSSLPTHPQGLVSDMAVIEEDIMGRESRETEVLPVRELEGGELPGSTDAVAQKAPNCDVQTTEDFTESELASTTKEPKPISTEESAAELKSAEQPASSSKVEVVFQAEAVPGPSVETSPVPQVEEVEPISVVVEAEPVTVAEPSLVPEEVESVPVVVEAEPATVAEPSPVPEEVEPIPVVVEAEPVTVAEPSPVPEEVEPIPVVEPVPVESVPLNKEMESVPAEESAPVLEKAEPIPVDEEAEPALVEEVEPVPVVVQAESLPVVEPLPVVEEAEPIPVVGGTESAPLAENVEAVPVFEEVDSEPVAGEAEALVAETELIPVIAEAGPAPVVAEEDAAQAPTAKPVEKAAPANMSVAVTNNTESKSSHTADRKAAPTPETRRRTRQRKTVVFSSPIEETEKATQSEEEKPQHQIESQVPSTPGRITRSAKHEQDSQVPLTPRRTTRRATEPKPQKEEEVHIDSTAVNAKPEATKQQTPQKTPPRKGTRRTRNSLLSIDEDISVTEDELHENELPVVPVTRTRSARKTRTAIMEVPESDTVVPEEQPDDRPAKVPSSPGRVTRKSTRGISLALDIPQLATQEQAVVVEQEAVTPKRSRRTRKDSTAEEAKTTEAVAKELPVLDTSRRSTRSRLWNHLEHTRKGEEKEERLILDTPLEVEPGTEVADALMERLKDEEAKESKGVRSEEGLGTSTAGTTSTRAKRRGTKAALEQAPSVPPPVTEALDGNEEESTNKRGTKLEAAEAQGQVQPKAPRTGRRTRASRASEADASPQRDPVLLSPPQTRRKSKARKMDSSVLNDVISEPQTESSAPVTRARRPAAASIPQTSNDEESDLGGQAGKHETEAAKSRKKRATRTKATAGSPPPVKINLISPMASPAELAPGVDKKEKAEAPLQRMNLRRKRLLDTIFPKPVTRRKML
ncbi:protein ELYS [Megalops cyprinoides]|uniref:protein ELYS n=1 Tax=Megalops cyprinoides TaxID=118141 RepID=UPI00186474A5|nr:protein ELYS [Megalops cyprinoides]